MTTYRLEATAGAELDVEAAFDWYEGEEPGLGPEFLDELSVAYQRILDHPLGYQDLRSGTPGIDASISLCDLFFA